MVGMVRAIPVAMAPTMKIETLMTHIISFSEAWKVRQIWSLLPGIKLPGFFRFGEWTYYGNEGRSILRNL